MAAPAAASRSGNNNAASPPAPTPAAPGGSIRLNFQNASLADVLNYLSAAAGFIITQETPVTGTVNVVSQQPVSIDEAVDLLSSILADKGYAVVRNGRILKIVSLQDAPKRGDVPVYNTADPDKIPRKDNLVTQILPVRYAEVGKLVDNLRPLLSNNATISSNDSSNAIILTDTQTNIHRMAEIIHALDTSISGISQIKVFTLRFSDAKGLADVLTQLFSPSQNATTTATTSSATCRRSSSGSSTASAGRAAAAGCRLPPTARAAERGAAGRRARGRRGRRDEQLGHRRRARRGDERGRRGHRPTRHQHERHHRDADLSPAARRRHRDGRQPEHALRRHGHNTNTAGNNNNNNNRGGNQGNRGQQGNQNAANGRSERSLLQSRVVVVADARTNSVLVSASHDTMAQVSLTIGRLDADKSRKQHVFVYTLKHGDPDNVATILRGMYSTTNTGNSSPPSPSPPLSALPTRTQQREPARRSPTRSAASTSTNGSR